VLLAPASIPFPGCLPQHLPDITGQVTNRIQAITLARFVLANEQKVMKKALGLQPGFLFLGLGDNSCPPPNPDTGSRFCRDNAFQGEGLPSNRCRIDNAIAHSSSWGNRENRQRCLNQVWCPPNRGEEEFLKRT
jgi:hypothetical protein